MIILSLSNCICIGRANGVYNAYHLQYFSLMELAIVTDVHDSCLSKVISFNWSFEKNSSFLIYRTMHLLLPLIFKDLMLLLIIMWCILVYAFNLLCLRESTRLSRLNLLMGLFLFIYFTILCWLFDYLGAYHPSK